MYAFLLSYAICKEKKLDFALTSLRKALAATTPRGVVIWLK